MPSSAIIRAARVLCRHAVHSGESSRRLYSLSQADANDGSGKSAHASPITLSGERPHEEHLLPSEGRSTVLICARSQSISAAGPWISVSFPPSSHILSAAPSDEMAAVMHLMHAGDPASGTWSHPLQWTLSIPHGS